jgi:hypothetical protein
MTLWGTGSIPLGAEVDGYPIRTGLCRGDSNLGKFECTTTGYSVMSQDPPEPAAPGACPVGGYFKRYSKIGLNHIIRFENGDVLWMLPVDPAGEPDASYLCLEKINATAYRPVAQVVTWEIKGGSGPYKDATGRATFRLTGDVVPLGDTNFMQAVHPGPFEGYIIMK